MFEIPIQAAIGGKIIARETVKAMRKDVLAKCYGGDIPEKEEAAWKSRRRARSACARSATVQVPSEAFMAVLKITDMTRSVIYTSPFA